MEVSKTQRIDWPSALMALVTTVALMWAGWLQFGPEPPAEPPGIGKMPPPLMLMDAKTREPLVLLGLNGRVVWLTFWTAGTPAGYRGLDPFWARLKVHRKFTMVAAAVDSAAPERVMSVVGPEGTGVPVYLATPETCRAFGAVPGNLPLHVLIDETGHVGAVAHGLGRDVLDRLAVQAERWLDELEPLGNTRFAMAAGEVRPISGRQGRERRDERGGPPRPGAVGRRGRSPS